MQRAVNGFEQSVHNVDEKIKTMEWKISQVNKAAINIEDDSDFNLLKLFPMVQELKKDSEKAKIESETITTELQQANGDLRLVYDNLQKKYSQLCDKVSDIN